MPHSTVVRRCSLALSLLGSAALLCACGSARTEIPDRVVPPPTLQQAAADLTTEAAPTEPETTAPATTASAFKSPGEKHPLPGGTLAASYPRVGVRPPKGVAPPPVGQSWAVVNVRYCAADATPIDGALVDPARFKVEVPGQGEIVPAPGAPALAKGPLAAGTAGTPSVAAGTCLEGSIAYLVAGEGHIEAVIFDSGAGLLRWAS